MEWDSFERLVLCMARLLDGANDVRRYGVSGQAQNGVDVVGFFGDKTPTVYQARRWRRFGAADLDVAVTEYATGPRPFNAGRIVVAVASEARKTSVITKLAELRETHSEIEIELWDRGYISEQLRDKPDVVTTFFGPATAQSFCSAGRREAARSGGPVSADAILRGPIAHLGLQSELARAESAVNERPVEAAAAFAAIADRLELSPFAGHAVRVREQQARALRDAGRAAEAARILLQLGWRLLDAGDPFAAQRQVQEIVGAGDAVPDNLSRAAAALSAAAGIRYEHAVTLDHLAAAFDELEEGDPHRSDAAVVVAEEAVAARRPEIVRSRHRTLERLAEQQASGGPDQLVEARLRTCLADCCGGWDSLATGARQRFSPRVTAWILARHARYLALTLRPELSVERWQDAAERACAEGMYDDAADWLYALRAVKVQYGSFDRGINDVHRLAQALRSSGGGTLLPQPYSARERALSLLLDGRWPDALEALGRYLWRATAGADWSGEIEAHEQLGDLFARTGRPDEAVQHFIRGGNGKKLEALAADLPDAALTLSTGLLSEAPWERTAAYIFVTAVADLLVDGDAAAWATVAVRDVVVASPQSFVLLGGEPKLAAFKALGELSSLIDEQEAEMVLRLGDLLVQREPNTYRHTDEAQVLATMGIARAHLPLRKGALEQLLQALLVDQRMANLVLSQGQDLLRADPALVERILAAAAGEGNINAALALMLAGADMNSAVALARERFEAALAPRVHEQGTQSFGTGLPATAPLMTLLDEAERVAFGRSMLALACDSEEPALNRREALFAVLPIAKHLPDGARDEFFDKSLAFARGIHDAGEGAELFPGAMDPLSRFRANLGPASLKPDGLQVAACLARTPEQFREVESEAKELLAEADERTCNAIAQALSFIGPSALSIDIGLFSAHPSPWIRALAAFSWAQQADPDAAVGQRLARDASRHVRSALLTGAKGGPAHQEVWEVLTSDPRRSIRRRAVLAMGTHREAGLS
jgi:hypothetical protein